MAWGLTAGVYWGRRGPELAQWPWPWWKGARVQSNLEREGYRKWRSPGCFGGSWLSSGEKYLLSVLVFDKWEDPLKKIWTRRQGQCELLLLEEMLVPLSKGCFSLQRGTIHCTVFRHKQLCLDTLVAVGWESFMTIINANLWILLYCCLSF